MDKPHVQFNMASCLSTHFVDWCHRCVLMIVLWTAYICATRPERNSFTHLHAPSRSRILRYTSSTMRIFQPTPKYHSKNMKTKCKRKSVHVNISLADAPLCVTDKVVIVGAFRNENLHIYCEVHADPPPRYVQIVNLSSIHWCYAYGFRFCAGIRRIKARL